MVLKHTVRDVASISPDMMNLAHDVITQINDGGVKMDEQEVKESKASNFIKRMAEKITMLKSDQKKVLIREKVKHDFVMGMIPAIDRLSEQGLDIDFSTYGSITMYLKDPETHDEAWEIVSKIQDEFAKDGYTVEVRKEFNAWRDRPYWNWRIYFNWGSYEKAILKGYNKDFKLKDVARLFLTVPNAEPDPDCIARQEVSVNKSWVCEKKL
jgi:hypothetical protein